MRFSPSGIVALVACLSLLLLGEVFAAPALVAPPMLLPAAPLEASVWVQTIEETDVSLQVWNNAQEQWKTVDAVRTSQTQRFTAILTAERLSPGGVYKSRLLAGAENYPLELRTAPLLPEVGDEPEFSILVAAGVDPSQAGFKEIAGSPVMHLWLDSPVLSEADYRSPSGPKAAHETFHRIESLASLLSGAQNISVPGPRSVGPAGSDSRHWLRSFVYSAYDLYSPSPLSGRSGQRFGLGGWSWVWADVELFVLDTEFCRNASTGEILGKQQMEWLLSALGISKARYKIIVSGVPLLPVITDPVAFTASPQERDRLISALRQPGVLVLSSSTSGQGELSQSPPSVAHSFYELTLGSSSRNGSAEKSLNYLREPGTLMTEPHTALIEFLGVGPDRNIRVSVRTLEGNEIWATRLRD